MMINLKTRWSDKTGEIPFNEYPRPQFERDSFINLNGYWDLEFTKDDKFPEDYSDRILVPFSPETILSGVEKTLLPGDYLWYRRTFEADGQKGRLILHFGAVDQICKVYINGKLVTENRGGYYPFETDITDYIDESNEIIVCVQDYSDTNSMEFGKQKIKRGGIWYTSQSGIWQTVWMEWVPEKYLKSVKITPYLSDKKINFIFDKTDNSIPVKIDISFDGQFITSVTANENDIDIPLDNIKEWSPEEPNLYDVTFTYGEDKVDSYFAMRSVSIEKAADGKKRIFLNGKPYFPNGLLDQGYWSDGLYTPANEEAMIFDISEAKRLGYNTLRKHIKIEPLRWYYLCDKIGMLVFQDMVNGGTNYNMWYTLGFQVTGIPIADDKNHRKGFGRLDEAMQKEFEINLHRMIEHLYNCPCIVEWTIFNEGWGQFESAYFYDEVKKMDPTRLIDPASGWHDQGCGDFNSEHNYFRKQKYKEDKRGDDRPYIISEFGGYALKYKEHSFNLNKTYGYRPIKDEEDLNRQVRRLYQEEILPAVKDGLCAAIYTQVSDVEDEVNGLFTYDREIVKFKEETVSEVYKEIEEIYKKL